MLDLFDENKKRPGLTVKIIIFNPDLIHENKWYTIATSCNKQIICDNFEDEKLFKKYLKKYEWIEGITHDDNVCYTWINKESIIQKTELADSLNVTDEWLSKNINCEYIDYDKNNPRLMVECFMHEYDDPYERKSIFENHEANMIKAYQCDCCNEDYCEECGCCMQENGEQSSRKIDCAHSIITSNDYPEKITISDITDDTVTLNLYCPCCGDNTITIKNYPINKIPIKDRALYLLQYFEIEDKEELDFAYKFLDKE